MASPTTRQHNGPALRVIRERSELTVREMCDLLQQQEGLRVHPNHIRNIETNARGASPKLIGAIARVLRIPPVALLAPHTQQGAK